MARQARPALERFMEKVDQNGPIPEYRPDLGPCWLWTGGVRESGYGYFWLDTRSASSISAHTAGWRLLRGPIPEGLEPDHLCRVRRCVNPEHLEPVTHQENMHRSEMIGGYVRQTHCKYGHPFDEANTYQAPRGRECRKCNVIRVRAWRQRQKIGAAYG